jgi:hypothetical protein
VLKLYWIIYFIKKKQKWMFTLKLKSLLVSLLGQNVGCKHKSNFRGKHAHLREEPDYGL